MSLKEGSEYLLSTCYRPATLQMRKQTKSEALCLSPTPECGGAERQTQLHGTSGQLRGLLCGSEAASYLPTPVVFIFEESGQDHQCLTGCFGSSRLSRILRTVFLLLPGSFSSFQFPVPPLSQSEDLLQGWGKRTQYRGNSGSVLPDPFPFQHQTKSAKHRSEKQHPLTSMKGEKV